MACRPMKPETSEILNRRFGHLFPDKENDMTDERFDSASDERTNNNVMRHEYRTLSENEKIDMKAIKDAGLDFVNHLDTIASHGPNGMTRELALAKTKIEEAVMWAVKHTTR